MTERENFFRVYNRQAPAWTPCFYDAYQPMGSRLINNNGAMGKGGRDMFGVNWLVTADTGYQAIADPREHLFDDVTRWREYVRFPDLDAMDWEAAARDDLAMADPNKVLAFFGMEGNYLRLCSMMGVCEALVAMLEEPEAVCEFFEAYTDFRIKVVEKVAKYYRPDVFVDGDDVCSSDGLFFSPAIYRELIKPFEMKLGKAITDNGMILEHHICGKCDAILPDLIERGTTIWQMAQVMNDLPADKAQYGDKLLFHGGWDSTGIHNDENATEEQVRAEVRRCIDSYGADGHFMLFPVIIGDPAGTMNRKRAWASDECRKYSEKLFR